MDEPEKPFACTMPDCGMTFTNEDHLHVHTKKHDMVLQLGSEQKAAFVADQTPTPTRFIRNCEEVGLFQDLQNVNPFDEGFKRAMETKPHGILSLENAISTPSSDDLHTPQMMFPLLDGDAALYSSSNNQRNITISRSSSDESGAIKEFEKTTISKLTNEVTISRIEKVDDKNNKDVRTDSVSFTNNVIKISNMVRKDSVEKNPVQTLIYEDTVIRDSNVITKDCVEKGQNDVPPIMSQKSLDFIVDSLNTDFEDTAKKKSKVNDEDYEVIIKLPNGKQVRMKAVEETTEKNAKELLKKALTEKVEIKKQKLNNINNVSTARVNNVNLVSNLLPISAGTLIPVTIVNNLPMVPPKVPIIPLKVEHKAVKRKGGKSGGIKSEEEPSSSKDKKTDMYKDLDSRSAASRRYRARLKETFEKNAQDNMKLREQNQKLAAECSVLRNVITRHISKCPDAADLNAWLAKYK